MSFDIKFNVACQATIFLLPVLYFLSKKAKKEKNAENRGGEADDGEQRGQSI